MHVLDAPGCVVFIKLACLAYNALSISKPTYLHALLTPRTPPRCLRSSGTRILAEPRHRTVMGSRAFHFSAPREWNRLPLYIRHKAVCHSRGVNPGGRDSPFRLWAGGSKGVAGELQAGRRRVVDGS